VLAADQRVSWWARQLRTVGLAGSMDELRARAYLDLLLGMDSRPARQVSGGGAADGPGQDGHGPDGSGPDGHGPDDFGPGRDGAGGDGPDDGGPGGGGSGPAEPAKPAPAGPVAGVIPPGFAGRVNLTIPLETLLGLADRPGDAAGIGPLDPWLARDLAAAAARNPKTTWCLTVTDQHGHAIGHGCARPAPDHHPAKRPKPAAPRAGPDPPGTWCFATGIPGQPDLIAVIEPIGTDPCDHRREAPGHDPGVMLRHLAQIRHATCTGPACRRPAVQADFEHNVPFEAGGRTCICNGDPKCRHDHRVKQDPRWRVDQLPDGNVRWTTPAGRQYTKEPTRYPI
jgi:hypothetical protein